MIRHDIYKIDKWNMMFVEETGRRLVVREISTQWGEETQEFFSRGQLEQWAKRRFNAADFKNRQDEVAEYMAKIKEI